MDRNAHVAGRKLTKCLIRDMRKGFMTNHTTVVVHRLNTTVFRQQKPE